MIKPKLIMMKTGLATALSFLLSFSVIAQDSFPINGVKDKRANAIALINATIVTANNQVIENGTLVIREDKIESVGQNVNVPAGYVKIDLKGKYVYPSFIDVYTNYGLPAPEQSGRRSFSGPEQIASDTKGAYNANEAIKSAYNAAEEFSIDQKTAESLRKAGFGTVLSFKKDGVARGTSTLVTLAGDNDNTVMLHAGAAAHYSLNKGSSSQQYPISAMGHIALLRQTYMDAKWYQDLSPRPFTDQSLEAWLASQHLPQIFEATGWMTLLRADKVGDEFGIQYIIKGGGDEYQRVSEVKNTGAKLILPLKYPDAFEVEDPLDAMSVSLADMKHWELAPANPGILEKNGVVFAITAADAKPGDFLANLRKAVMYGLSKQQALRALTQIPASMLGVYSRVGSLDNNKLANLLVTSGDIFEADTEIYQNWVQGKLYEIKPLEDNRSGEYGLQLDGQEYNLHITGKSGSYKGEIKVNDTTDLAVNVKFDNELITMSFSTDVENKEKSLWRMSGWSTADGFEGKAEGMDGHLVDWSATFQEKLVKKEKKKEEQALELGNIIYPFVAQGAVELPKQETILIKNGTVWTNEEEGVLKNTDVLLKGGKIEKIGKGLSDKADRIIDAEGKHITSGIIDEHSHLAASSINDIATNSSMVRIGDVLNSEDIGLYRALAGGITTLQVLHGSANPIGGQSALIKPRWGVAPEDLKIQGADGFIKFALGENVKRSRNTSSIRYPQTRMGVEQVYVDAFTNALEYEKEWKAYNSLSAKQKANAKPPRKDLVHETMLEIIRGKRFISCHSYVQSEINMLMKVAEQFGFRINTFTHILEGYKVADIMKEHGAGASSFSDWWNYKWEVRYAIPYNAAIMHKEGVTTAINSDSGEMIRRLNQEAAKSIKYGGLSEEDALKLVTLNPAKLLHLDDRMGSIKKGKDADIVVWSDHPLSIYARAEKTIIEGAVYFDMEKDKEQREVIKKERARLIARMKDAKKAGAKTSLRSSAVKEDFHCEDVLGWETDLSDR